MASTAQDPIPYATPAARSRWGDVRRWLARRGSTSGPRLIALALLALAGVMCMSPEQNNVRLYDAGELVFRIALILFAIEYLLSFVH